MNALAWYVITSVPPFTAIALTTSLASPQQVNTTITLSATATGGTNVLYRFWLYNPAANPAWRQLQAFSLQATCPWTPTTAGSYLISATAQDGASGMEANTMAWYGITGSSTLTAVTVTTTPNSPQPANTPITLSADGDGRDERQYQFWVYNPIATPAWSQLQAFSPRTPAPGPRPRRQLPAFRHRAGRRHRV